MSTPLLTDAQLRETLDLIEKHGSLRSASKATGIPRPSLQHRTRVARQRGILPTSEQLDVMHGWSPVHDLTKVVPAPLIVRGTSTLYNKGELSLQWVKTKLDDRLVEEALRAAVEALAQDIPRAVRTPSPFTVHEHLCNLYTLTDCHIGMRAWAKETGDNWDLEIAEDMLCAAVDYLIEASPAAAVGLVNQLGDFLHFDSLVPVTPTSGHQLDVDSRYSKVVQVATRILRRVITAALRKHEKVVVLIAEGNHDLASSVWLRHLFSLLFENEPRVEVIDSEMPYYCYVHGETMLAFHHGHLQKNEQLPGTFAAQFPREWGATTRRYCHTGHRHHYEAKEHGGMTVVQHPTLAGRDAYASRGGWVADRSMTALTYDSKYGLVSSVSVNPDMLRSVTSS